LADEFVPERDMGAPAEAERCHKVSEVAHDTRVAGTEHQLRCGLGANSPADYRRARFHVPHHIRGIALTPTTMRNPHHGSPSVAPPSGIAFRSSAMPDGLSFRCHTISPFGWIPEYVNHFAQVALSARAMRGRCPGARP
jgi:hypothetical protein